MFCSELGQSSNTTSAANQKTVLSDHQQVRTLFVTLSVYTNCKRPVHYSSTVICRQTDTHISQRLTDSKTLSFMLKQFTVWMTLFLCVTPAFELPYANKLTDWLNISESSIKQSCHARSNHTRSKCHEKTNLSNGKKSDKSNVKLISVQLLMIFFQPYWWNHTNSQIAASCSLTGLWIDFQLTDDQLNQSSIMKRHKVEISVANSQASDVTLLIAPFPRLTQASDQQH